MATNIVSSLTPTFDASIPVPDNGEYANAAALTAMVKPIANRTEYLKQILEGAPWRRAGFFEDFATIVGASDLTDAVMFDTPWQSFGTNPASFSFSSLSDAYGVLARTHSDGTVSSNLLSKGVIPSVANRLCKAEALRRVVCRVRTANISSGMNFEVGIDSDSAHGVAAGNAACITAIFKPADSANWRLRIANGAASVYVDTGIPVAVNTWYELDLASDGNTVVSLSVDGGTPVVANPASLPSMSTDVAFVLRYGMPNAGASRTWSTDFTYAEFDMASRVL